MKDTRAIMMVAMVGLLAMLLAMPGTALAIPESYTGTLEAPVLVGDPGLEGTGVWVDPSPGTPITSLTYTVSRNSAADPWLYCYDFSTTAQGGLSHIIIEVSAPDPANTEKPYFTADDVVPGSASAGWELDWWNQAGPGNSNPGLPADIYGIKIEGNSQTVDQLCFESFKTPVWGDFYAKDGAAGGEGENAAWNAGFLDPDPQLPYTTDPSLTNFHLLVPDTTPVIDLGRIDAEKWFDADSDGIWDPDEDPIEGWEIFLRDSAGAVTSKLTDINGIVQFLNLPTTPGGLTYDVWEEFRDMYLPTFPTGSEVGDNWTVKSDGVMGRYYEVTLSDAIPTPQVSGLQVALSFGNAPIPEPGSLLIVALGLAGLGRSRKRRS